MGGVDREGIYEMKILVATLLLALIVIAGGYSLFNTKSQDTIVVSDKVENQLSSVSRRDAELSQDISNRAVTERPENSELAQITNIISTEENYLEELEWIELLEEENLTATDSILQLYSMLTHSEPALRLAALESISAYQHDDVKHILNKALYDPDPEIRRAAVDGLGQRMDESVISYLEAVLYDSDLQVRKAAIWAIAYLESDQGIHMLVPLLSDNHEDIRLNAVSALGEIGGENISNYLENHIHDTDENVRMSALAILNEIEAER
jgi:HEAT repeat protein